MFVDAFKVEVEKLEKAHKEQVDKVLLYFHLFLQMRTTLYYMVFYDNCTNIMFFRQMQP